MAIVVGALVVVCILGSLTLGFLGALASRSTTSGPTAPQQAAAPIATYDQAGFTEYWAEWSDTTWGQRVQRFEWTRNDELTAHTNLFPDADAQAPALQLCSAMAAYWIGTPDRPAVRVLDVADQILASDYGVGSGPQCGWRR